VNRYRQRKWIERGTAPLRNRIVVKKKWGNVCIGMRGQMVREYWSEMKEWPMEVCLKS
jgi:hypothetical protein